MTKSEGSPVLFDYPNMSWNVFIMMRFRDTPQHKETLSVIREALSYYGVNGLRADDKSYADSLWANVKAYIDACDSGIAVFEQIEDETFNPNISLELGYMMAQQKPVLLLKEKHLKALPTDIVGQLYKVFDSYAIGTTVPPRILEWLRDIGIAKSPAERMVLFVSYGGTCRCAMAKVTVDQALARRNLPYRLRVVSVAYAFGSSERASRGARRAVFEKYGSDFLEHHRVTHRNDGLLDDANLILVMEDGLCEGLPTEKTFLFNEFFGIEGDVSNPWPDDEDDAARKRYRECMNHLAVTIESGVDRLLEYLNEP